MPMGKRASGIMCFAVMAAVFVAQAAKESLSFHGDVEIPAGLAEIQIPRGGFVEVAR